MKKILYINPLGENIRFISSLSDGVFTENISLPFLEFAENFPKILTENFLKNFYNEIWLIAWPWAFTKMRIVTLAVNAIKFSHPNLIIKTAHFFDFFKNFSNLTPILEANNNEFIYLSTNGEETFCLKKDLPEGNYIGLFDTTSTNFDKLRQYFGELRQISTENVDISTKIDNSSTYTDFYEDFSEINKFFEHISETPYSEPIYIKPPHITYGKK